MTLRLLPLLLLPLVAPGADPIDAFPAPEEGVSRHVIDLPGHDDPETLRVEILVGKTVLVDGVNRHFFGGSLEERTVKGFGYSYHILDKLGPMAGTRMAAPPGQPKVERFVTLGGDPYLVRYNPRLPLVVYVPDGVEVRYRLWRAEPETEPIPER